MVPLAALGHRDAGHGRSLGGEDAGRGVLPHETATRRGAQLGGGGQEDARVRLAVLLVLGRMDQRESVSQPEVLERGVDEPVLRGRRDGQREAVRDWQRSMACSAPGLS